MHLSPQTDQTRLEAELDFIQGQQQELEQVIEPLEAAAASTTPAQHQGDRQRENMYLLAQVSLFFLETMVEKYSTLITKVMLPLHISSSCL